MGFFGNKKLKKENQILRESNKMKNERIRELEDLCEEKDSFFSELMSDATKHGSSLGAKHMAERKQYLNENKK